MQPLPQRDRYTPIDILRGLSLYGVLLVNLLTLFRVSLFTHILGEDTPSDAPGRLIAMLVAALLEFKAVTLFSFLFGVGVAIQAERARNHKAFLLRRFLILLAIGLVHLLLIWNGDILTLYAICGILLIPTLRLSNTAGSIVAAAFIIVPYFVPIPLAFPTSDVVKAHALQATHIYSQGGFSQIFMFRWHETSVFIAPLLIYILPRTLGLMLLGIAAWRSGLLTARRDLWLPIGVLAGTIGLVGILLHNDLLQIPLAFAYAAAVLLWNPRARWIAAGGQMALTNYLTQSVVFCTAFYGFGLGLFGRLEVVPTAIAGTAFYFAQLMFSRWWLQRFHFGPIEWFWRSLTYGRRQPFRRHPVEYDGSSLP